MGIAPAVNGHVTGAAGYRIIVDVPSRHPKLGFDKYIQTLSRMVQESPPRFAIGIFGSWGSGKTTLMEAIRTDLEAAPNVITVDFSAWRYEKEQHLIVPLIDAIRDAVVGWLEEHQATLQNEVSNVRAGARLLGAVTKAMLAGLSLKIGMPGALEVSFDANKALAGAEHADEAAAAEKVPRSFYYAAFQAMKEAFAKIGTGQDRRIVVFIDDLDRCLPFGALEVLESMKLFFDIPGFIFVVGLDRAVVEWCIDTRYQRERPAGTAVAEDSYTVKGSDYIDKIFQVPFRLPQVATGDIDQFVGAVIEDNGLGEAQSQHLRDVVLPHLRFVVGDLGVNPRRLKQYLNSYILQGGVKPGLNADAVLAIQTITYRGEVDWKRVRDALLSDRRLLLDALKINDPGQRARALEDLDPDYAAIPDSFLEYIAAGMSGPDGPGRPLLDLGDTIDDYLYAGQAALSTATTEFVTVIPQVSKLRRLLREAVAEDGKVLPGIDGFRKETELAQSMVLSVPGAIGQLVLRTLQDILQSAPLSSEQLGDPSPVLRDWRIETEEQIKLAKKTLLRAYDASRVPAAGIGPFVSPPAGSTTA